MFRIDSYLRDISMFRLFNFGSIAMVVVHAYAHTHAHTQMHTPWKYRNRDEDNDKMYSIQPVMLQNAHNQFVDSPVTDKQCQCLSFARFNEFLCGQHVLLVPITVPTRAVLRPFYNSNPNAGMQFILLRCAFMFHLS